MQKKLSYSVPLQRGIFNTSYVIFFELHLGAKGGYIGEHRGQHGRAWESIGGASGEHRGSIGLWEHRGVFLGIFVSHLSFANDKLGLNISVLPSVTWSEQRGSG